MAWRVRERSARHDAPAHRRSGYDRGHLAAAGNHAYSADAMHDTFYLSNISPQVGKGFNRDKWNELEIVRARACAAARARPDAGRQYVRSLVSSYRRVHVCTGPLFLPARGPDGRMYVRYEVIGEDGAVSVPTHFFKVLALESADGRIVTESYVLPNASIDAARPLADFRVPLRTVERAAGLVFFQRVSGLHDATGGARAGA